MFAVWMSVDPLCLVCLSDSPHRGIETNLELSPGEATMEGGRNPLGGVLNEQAMCKVEELETENSGLRSMLVDLQVMLATIGFRDNIR